MQQPCPYLATQLVPRLLLLGRAARRSLFLGLIAVVDINPLGYPLIHLTLVVHQDLTESLLGRLDQIAVAFGRLLVAVGLRVPNAMGARNKHQRVLSTHVSPRSVYSESMRPTSLYHLDSHV